LFLEVVTGARFPDVSRALPEAGTAATRVRIDPDDARYLLPALDRLPGGDEMNVPVTLDVNGSVAVRARGAGGPATELVLAPSASEGGPLRLDSNRDYLGQRPCLEKSPAGQGAYWVGVGVRAGKMAADPVAESLKARPGGRTLELPGLRLIEARGD
jgi:hypothetical protein